MSKKILAAVAALVLVVAICATGTIAYLKAFSNNGKAIVNTFTASGGLIDPPGPEDPEDPEDPIEPDKLGNGFYIVEDVVSDDEGDAGKVTLTGNEYTVVPGVEIKKDPYILIKGKTEISSYLFVEVINTFGEDDERFTYDLTDGWYETSLTGNNGGKLYVYSEPVKSEDGSDVKIHILKDGEIGVSGEYKAKAEGTDTLSFYGYLCQEAGFEPEEAEGAENIKAAFIAAAEKAYPLCFEIDD